MQSLSRKIIIGSRGSDLALWQANFFQSQLNELNIPSEIKIITTKGDRIQHLSFDKIEGKGFFTKEIEAALINEEIDIAIHSHKDLETKQPPGLTISGVSYRENPAELLLINKNAVDYKQDFEFKQGAVIGTSSARRKSQIKNFRPDISIKDIRGNVPTRIDKLRSGEFDAILLAAAGVSRLNLDLSDLHVIEIDPRLFIPAAAQGVLAYQTRESDEEMKHVVHQIHHAQVKEEIEIERKILSGFGGGCHIPIGIYTTRKNDLFKVRVSYAKESDKIAKRAVFECDNLVEALAKFEDVRNHELPNRVLISKETIEGSYLQRASSAHNIELVGAPFIQTKKVSFELPNSYDWIFFSSSNAVEHFFAQTNVEQLGNVKFAAYGVSTKKALANFVDEIAFTAQPGQPDEVAAEFANEVKDSVVLFPVSQISKRSVQDCLDPAQCLNVVCYETIESPVKVDIDFDCIVFTSPSNVKGYHETNGRIKSLTKIIALGSSTENTLREMGYDCMVADFPSEVEVFTLLCS